MGMDVPDVAFAKWEDLESVRDSLGVKLDALLDDCKAEQRDLSEDEEGALELALQVRDDIKDELHRRELYNTREPISPDTPARTIDFPSVRVSANGDYSEPTNNGNGKRTYRSVFCGGKDVRLESGGFESFEQFCRCVASGRFDPRLESRTMVEGVGSLGGFTVPSVMASEIWSPVLEDSVVLSRAKLYVIDKGSGISIPILENYDHSAGPYGVVPSWVAEEAASTSQDMTFNSLELFTYKLMLYCTVSNMLLADGLGFQAQLGDAMKKGLAFTLDEVFLSGNGVGKPLGVLNDPAMITVSRSAAGSISYTDIISAFSRLHPSCVKGAVWVIHPTVIPELCGLVDAGNHNLWVPNVADKAPGRLLGLDVVLSEKLPELGSNGDILLCNFSNYAVALRREITLEKSNAPNWSRDLTDYRVGTRVGAHGLWSSPITPASGTTTLSWVVSLTA